MQKLWTELLLWLTYRTVLPAPAAYNFRYARPFAIGAGKSKGTKDGTATANAAKSKDGATGTGSPGPRPPRAVGHQLTVMRPIGMWPWR